MTQSTPSINELKSYTEYNVSTPTSVFTIGFQYEYNVDKINVHVDDVEATVAGYTVQHDSHGTITLEPAVPTGVVRLSRETNIDTSAHTFSAGAKFTAGNMDENFQQIRHAQQEVRDGFSKLSTDTYEIIDTLQDVGQAAQEAADAAEQAAQTANEAAAQVNDKVPQSEIDYIRKNGAALPYKDGIAYEENTVVVKDGVLQQWYGGGWAVVGEQEVKKYLLATGVPEAELDSEYNYLMERLAQIAVDKGWSADFVVDASGKNQQELNTGLSKIADMLSIESPVNGARLFVKSYNGVLNHALAVPYYAGTYFIYDHSKSGINDGVTIFNGWVRQFNGILKPEYAGAIGDGVTDDSAAFRLIRDVGFEYASNVARYNANVAVASYTVELSPFKNYLVKGDKILGSIHETDTTAPKLSIGFKVTGNDATITFEPLNEFDRLFNIDAFIERPKFEDFNIYVKSSNTVNSGVIWSLRSGYNGYSGASRMRVHGVRVDRASGTSNRIRRVFDVQGTTMADQILVDQSQFGGFKEFWYSNNPESVNNTIRNSSFNTTSSNIATYFNISRLGDNFNVVDCNMSIQAGDTVFNFIAPLNSGGTLINSNPAYQFHAIRNRFETYGSGEVIMLNSNHLKLNIEGLTSALASGSATTKWVWKACEMGSYQFDKCFLNNAQKLLAPIVSSVAYGTTVGTGVKLNDTAYQATLELGAWDGTNEYSVKDALVNKRKARSFRFRDCFSVNRGGAWDFDIVFDEDGLPNGIRKQNTITLNKAGTGFATEFRIPPYQVIDEISVTNSGPLPSTFNGYRVYFGAKADNNFIDYVDTLSNIVANTETVIFKGKGIVLNDSIINNVISVYPLQDGVEVTTKLLSSITVKYTALSTYRDNITSTANATVIKNTLLPKNVGATASRPTKAPYVGWQYFDTTLGKPIFVKTLSPVAWVDAVGVDV